MENARGARIKQMAVERPEPPKPRELREWGQQTAFASLYLAGS
jgi:hypothetical protein